MKTNSESCTFTRPALLPNAESRTAQAQPNDPTEAVLTLACDALACAVIIIDQSRRIVHANRAGEAILDRGIVLKRHSGPCARLCGATALARAIFAALSGPFTGRCPPVMLPDEQAPRIAYIHLVTPGLPDGPGLPDASVYAVVTIPASGPLDVADGQPFAQLYSLTESEIRVLVTLANGLSPANVSKALAISQTTLTTHLKHIFDKTGVRRQAQLVALFLRSLSPMRM